MKKIVFIASLLFSSVACASDKLTFSVSFDAFDSVSKNNALNRQDTLINQPIRLLNRFSTGITVKPFENSHLRFTYKTNTLWNFTEGYTSQGGYAVTQKVKSQSYIVSHPVSKKFTPYVVASDVTTITTINAGSKIINNGFMYGLGLAYFLNSHNGISLTYFLPSKTFNTKYSYGVSYTYFI